MTDDFFPSNSSSAPETPPLGMRNLKLTLSYRGAGFQGYQRQPHGPTAEAFLIKAWEVLTGEQARIIGCSRLDAGVDADHFVANLNTLASHPVESILRSLNGILWNVLRVPISVYDVSDAPHDFHARFHAIGKHYRYLIWHGRGRVAAYADRAWHIRKRELVEDLGGLFQVFVGTHDFSAYRSQDCQSSQTVRTIDRIAFWRHKGWPELGIVDVWGQGFLKNMIRNLVGNAVAVAAGDMALDELTAAFSHGDRSRMGPCAPGHGLCLKHVYYDPQLYREHMALRPDTQPMV